MSQILKVSEKNQIGRTFKVECINRTYVDYFFVQSIISYFFKIDLSTYAQTFVLHRQFVKLPNEILSPTCTYIRMYVSFKHGRLLHTYTRFFTWTCAFFVKKRTTGYVRTTGTGTGVKHSVLYELHRMCEIVCVYM